MPSSPRARFWRRALIATGLVVALGATAAWLALPVQYEAYALLKISGSQPSVLKPHLSDPGEFQFFKATQAQWVTSNLVVNAVLRDPAIHQLPTVRAHQDDPVVWLKDALVVDFPGDAEIMRISLETKRPEDSQQIVDKVVNVYLREIVEAEKRQRMASEAKLQSAFEKQGAEYQTALNQLNALEKIHKTSGSEAAQLKKRLALESLDSELVARRKLIERLDETELEAILDEARAVQPPETRTAETAPAAPEDAKASLPASLLKKKRAFLEEKLAETDARIAKMTQEVIGLESYSAQVAAKQEEIEGKRLHKNELGAEVDRIRIERLAAERITKIEDAWLTSENGDGLRRNMFAGAVAASGLALLTLGMAIGRPRSSRGSTSEQLDDRSV